MADGVDEVGAVQRVEVELGDAAVDEAHDLVGANRGGDEIAGLLVVLQPFETPAEPVWHARADSRAKPEHCLKLWMGMTPGTMGMVMPAARTRSR